jgi:hypothetical protein
MSSRKQENPNSLANLRPIPKGGSPIQGNGPHPIVKDIKAYIRSKLNEPALKDSDKTHLDKITEKMIDMAKGGNLKAQELAMSYGYGRPTQGIELSGIDGKPIQTADFTNLSNEELAQRIAQLKEMDGLNDEPKG